MASRLIQVSGGQTNWNQIIGTPTTLAGYGITNAAGLTANNTFDNSNTFRGSTTFNSTSDQSVVFQHQSSMPAIQLASQSARSFTIVNSLSVGDAKPAFLSFLRNGSTIINAGSDTDNSFAICYQNTNSSPPDSMYAPLKVGMIQVISTHSGGASIKFQNSAKGTNDGQYLWVVYNSKSEAGFPAKTGLHFYSYNVTDANKLYNPFSLLDENVVAINAPVRKTLDTPPANSTASGTQGDMRFCSDGIYCCVATNTWRRILWQTF